MGNDGGSIPKRRELVKEAARLPTTSELKASAQESLAHAWSNCPLSSAPLEPASTVSDWKGRLYNYEAVLQGLLPPSSRGGGGSVGEDDDDEQGGKKTDELAKAGIRSLKDVVRLKFATRRDDRTGVEVRACPVSMKELGASTRAVYVVPCGHVFAEVAMKEISGSTPAPATVADPPTDDNNNSDAAKKPQRSCPECSEAFTDRDVIPILSTDETELERLARRVDELKGLGLTHGLKKDKSSGGKNKKRKAEEEVGDGNAAEAKREKKKKDKDRKKNGGGGVADKEKEKDTGISSRINNSMTASLTAKVLAEQEEMSKRRRRMAHGYHKRSQVVR
ncbi:DUF602-domain-containing protein [Xylariomycetidae sp. FL2044]|nr:DUF602-domain-containing protein [Xylariomycetidae sp. FL2044]